MRESALWPKLREYWHPVAFSEDMDDGSISVTLLDDRIAVCRLGGEVKAFHDLCIHRGTPISLGWVEGEEIVCAYVDIGSEIRWRLLPAWVGLLRGRPVRPNPLCPIYAWRSKGKASAT